MRPGLQADISERGGQGQGALAVDDGAVHLTCHPAIEAHGGIDRPEPPLVAQRLAEGLGPAQVLEHPPRGFAQGIERAVYPEMEVDGLLGDGSTVGEMRQGDERLLESRQRLAVGRARLGFVPRLEAVHQGLLPHLAP